MKYDPTVKESPESAVTQALHDFFGDLASIVRRVVVLECFVVAFDFRVQLVAVGRQLVVSMNMRVVTPRLESELEIAPRPSHQHASHSLRPV